MMFWSAYLSPFPRPKPAKQRLEMSPGGTDQIFIGNMSWAGDARLELKKGTGEHQ